MVTRGDAMNPCRACGAILAMELCGVIDKGDAVCRAHGDVPRAREHELLAIDGIPAATYPLLPTTEALTDAVARWKHSSWQCELCSWWNRKSVHACASCLADRGAKVVDPNADTAVIDVEPPVCWYCTTRHASMDDCPNPTGEPWGGE